MVLGCFRLIVQYSDFTPVMKIEVLVETSVLIYDTPRFVASLKKGEKKEKKKGKRKRKKRKKRKEKRERK